MISNMKKGDHIALDETSCGPMCQHPACWQSNTRREKGFPKMMEKVHPVPDIELDLPTVKVWNMLNDYGEDSRDKYPAKYAGKPQHERTNLMLTDLKNPVRTNSIKVTRVPQTSPKSSNGQAQTAKLGPKFNSVEVQEVFDPEDLQATWDATFLPKKYYVWVPNKKKKRRKKTGTILQVDGGAWDKTATQFVRSKDLTEEMVPKDIENERLLTKKKCTQLSKSPSYRHYPVTPRTTRSPSRMDYDPEGLRSTLSSKLSVPLTRSGLLYASISELLDLPRDILVQVLDNTKQSDLLSRDKIREIIQRVMPQSADRAAGTLTSTDLLQPKKIYLHEGNKNVRQPHLMETKPVFYLDDDVVDEASEEDYDSEAYGSLKDHYFSATAGPPDLRKYKKPLPSIAGYPRAVSAGDMTITKIPSISLGLPELPSGIRQTRPFTYSRKAEYDFTLAPVPTPPTSIRSTMTPASEHGTTGRMPSDITARSEVGSSVKQSPRMAEAGARQQVSRELSPLHAVLPTFSTRVPKGPVTTPAKSPRSAPMVRDGSTVTATPQDWPPVEKAGSPVHIRAPVNTPGSMSQDIGLGTIKETGQEYSDQPLPMSRGGRSVRFEIPEIPPPPSSPQESEEGVPVGEQSRNTVTVNTFIPKDTPSVSNNPMSGVTTIATDQNTVHTSLNTRENSLVKSGKSQSGSRVRELSMVSSPEPWPQVNEADFDIPPHPKSDSTLHATSSGPKASSSEDFDKDKNQSSNTKREIKVEIARHSPEPEEPTSEFVNKDTEPVSKVKKIMAESRKAESPAPPPPSPEAKDDMITKSGNDKKTLSAGDHKSKADGDASSMTVMQIHPKGVTHKLSKQRQIDTFVNIDIPAVHDLEPPKNEIKYEQRETIIEEPEQEIEESSKRETLESVQSTLANRTISEADTEAISSVVEPAISQASQGPALSEDFSEKQEMGQLFGDWTGVVGNSSDVDTQAMLESDKQDLDMTEDGGDHEGFKEDLRKEYEKLEKETNSIDNDAKEKKETTDLNEESSADK